MKRLAKKLLIGATAALIALVAVELAYRVHVYGWRALVPSELDSVKPGNHRALVQPGSVEGLAYEPSDQTLLLLCKDARNDDLEDVVAIFRWSLETRESVGPPITVPLTDITGRIDGGSLHPSGIERHPQTGTYFIVAASEAVIVEVHSDGTVLDVLELRKRSHPQTEGITFTPDGRLFLADEGRTRRGQIKSYRRTPER